MTKTQNYQFQELIGKRIFHSVYLAIDISSGEKVTIKIIDTCQINLQLEALINEVNQLKEFHRENIALYKDHFFENQCFYIVTEFVE
jgi:serine/threonine protein kinase